MDTLLRKVAVSYSPLIVEALIPHTTLIRAALGATEQFYQPGYRFHKAGVMLMDLSPEEIIQGSIFGCQTRRERSWELMEVVDSPNRQF